MDPIPGVSIQFAGHSLLTILNVFSIADTAELGLILVLVLCSAFMSGSESAFFSLTNKELLDLQQRPTSLKQTILDLHARPKRLLATILIANTFINIMFAIVAARLLDKIDFGGNEVLKQFVDVILITFIIVLLGEVVPKVYATQHNVRFASLTAFPLLVLTRLFSPLSYLLTSSTRFIERRMGEKGYKAVSLDDLKHAIEITSDEATSQEEKQILRGIVNFGNTYVRQIMRSRIDVVAHDLSTPFSELVQAINENRYSRLPVYDGSFDKVVGILYIKDLIPYLNEEPDFDWRSLVRPPYFVPDTKKIDTLLQEIKQKKVHMAIVVDEYGGTSGIVTLEDIIEEIVGDINDEFDEEEVFYSRLDENTLVFDGKTALTDVVRIMDLEDDAFEEVRGEAETIGGLLIELCGRIPATGQMLKYDTFAFTAELTDRRRVRRVKITQLPAADEAQE